MSEKRKVVQIICGVWIIGLLGNMPVTAQPTPEAALKNLEKLSERGRFLKQRMGKNINLLSTGNQMMVSLGEKWNTMRPQLEAAAKEGGFSGKNGKNKNLLGNALSNPFIGNRIFEPSDFFSRFSGSTQSEPSIGWCGNNIVCGFNDSGSISATLFPAFDPSLPQSPSPSGSISGIGWSRSSKAGSAFTDKGVLVADPIPEGVLFRNLTGSPVVRAASKSVFYFACLAEDLTASEEIFSGITVSKSTNGGFTWGGARMAIAKSGFDHFLDKPWMAVRAGSNDIIYITYTDADFSGFENIRMAIEFVKSTDGGITWSDPLVIAEKLEGENVTDSQIAVGPEGEIYVAWEEFSIDLMDRKIKIRKSTNGGNSFDKEIEISPVTSVGNSIYLQGVFRASLDLQGLFVDNSHTATRGNVYVVWHDGRNLTQNDMNSFDGQYHFADILFSKSTNGGGSWSSPVRVNNDVITKQADQFMPAIAVNKTGQIGILFYDRKYNLRNFLIDVTFATSMNGGATWINKKVTKKSFVPVTGWNDFFVNPFYMGDYIALAQDVSETYSGFVGAWGDNSLGDANIAIDQLK